MQRKFRLKGLRTFSNVRNKGKTYKNRLILVIVTPNSLCHVRIGVAVGKRIGNAVQRNQVKRRVRACVQKLLPSIEMGWDIILIARKPIRQANFEEIRSAVLELFSQAGFFPAIDCQ